MQMQTYIYVLHSSDLRKKRSILKTSHFVPVPNGYKYIVAAMIFSKINLVSLLMEFHNRNADGFVPCLVLSLHLMY